MYNFKGHTEHVVSARQLNTIPIVLHERVSAGGNNSPVTDTREGAARGRDGYQLAAG